MARAPEDHSSRGYVEDLASGDSTWDMSSWEVDDSDAAWIEALERPPGWPVDDDEDDDDDR